MVSASVPIRWSNPTFSFLSLSPHVASSDTEKHFNNMIFFFFFWFISIIRNVQFLADFKPLDGRFCSSNDKLKFFSKRKESIYRKKS